MSAQEPNKQILGTLKSEAPLARSDGITLPEALKVLLEWEAPGWLYKKRDREYFTTIGAIAFLLIVILFFLKEWIMIMLIIAIAFAAYVMATVKPQGVKNQITNKGIVVGDKKFKWEELISFWFERKWDQDVLKIGTLIGFSRHLVFLLGEVKPDQVKRVLSSYLSQEEPEKTWVDNASEWLSRRIPLESKDKR